MEGNEERKEGKLQEREGSEGRKEQKEARGRKQKGRKGAGAGSPETCSIADHPPRLMDVAMIHACLEHSAEIGWRPFSGQLGYFISSYFILFCCGQ